MKVSKRTDYALRAIFTLVAAHGNNPISIRELARSNRIPRRFLEHILLEMKSRGWVDSIQGKYGGYFLAKSPAEITLGQIVRYFDGILAPIGCVSISRYEACTQESICRFRRVFLDVRNYVASVMDRATLEQVYAGEIVSNREVFMSDFTAGDGI